MIVFRLVAVVLALFLVACGSGGLTADAGQDSTSDSGGRSDGGRVDGTVIFTGDFEAAGNFTPGGTYSQFAPNIDTCEFDAMCTTDSLEIVTTQARRGSRAVKVVLRAGDTQRTSGTRAELQMGALYQVTLEEDFWYGWSVYVPTDWASDPDDMKVVHQWHAASGNPGPSPVIGLRLRADEWRITRELVNGASAITLWSARADKGVWTDWVMHMRWSTGQTGRFEAWKNGVLVHSEAGQNVVNGTTAAPYEKFGMYGTFTGVPQERVLFYDEVRVAKGPDAYDLVAP